MIYPITSITRTYRVVDKCGNSELCYQYININDTIPPTFTVPADAYISKDEDCEYNASVEITGNVDNAFDNCSNFIEVNYEDELITDTLGREVINRTWSVIDDFLNINNKVQKIYIEDSTPPVIHCPPDVLVENEIDIPEPFSSLNDFGLHGGQYDDNCEIIDSSFSLFYELKDTLVSPIELKRTYIISDADGNESVCLHKFKIENITFLHELNASNKFHFLVYPNPNKGIFTLDINGIDGNAIVEIFTSNGKFVERKLLYPIKNRITQEYNLSNLDTGFYSVRVTDEQKSVSKQFIIR